MHKTLKWHYTNQLQKNSQKSIELRKKKQKILEEVMDTETYKVAKEILDKFGDKTAAKPTELKPAIVLQQQQQQRVLQPVQVPRPNAQGTELRHRAVQQTGQRMNPAPVPYTPAPNVQAVSPAPKQPQQTPAHR